MSLRHPDTEPTAVQYLLPLIAIAYGLLIVVGDAWVVVPLAVFSGLLALPLLQEDSLARLLYGAETPLMARLRGRLDNRLTRWCAVMAGMVALMVPITVMLWPSALSFWVVVVAVPVILTAVAALVAVRNSRARSYQLLEITPLESDLLVTIYFRWMLVFGAGLLLVQAMMIILAAGLSSIDITNRVTVNASPAVTHGLVQLDNGAPADLEVVTVVFSAAGAFWGISLIGIAGGIALGIWWRTLLAVLVAPVGVLILTVGFGFLALFIIPVPGGGAFDWISGLLWPVMCAWPPITALLLMRAAARFARRE